MDEASVSASPWAAVTCALLIEPCPHLQLLFVCFCWIPALCVMYLELLTNLQQLYFCLLCSAWCGACNCACVQISGTAGVSTFLLDSHLIWFGIFCSCLFTHLSLSVSATCSIHHKNHSSFCTCILCSYHFSSQDPPLSLKSSNQ